MPARKSAAVLEMDSLATCMRWAGDTQLPLADIVCKFSPSLGERPSLLTHDGVITPYHKFGHNPHRRNERLNPGRHAHLALWARCALFSVQCRLDSNPRTHHAIP